MVKMFTTFALLIGISISIANCDSCIGQQFRAGHTLDEHCRHN